MMHLHLSFMPRECTGSCAGTGAGLAAHLLWGLAVLFWPLLGALNPISIMAHRMIWTVIFLGAVLAVTRRFRPCAPPLKADAHCSPSFLPPRCSA